MDIPATTSRRLYRLIPWLVRAAVPAGRVGTYILFTDRTPVYAGRSDTDLQRRLIEHARHARGDYYFQFNPHDGVHAAFVIECATFHAIDGLANRIHPAVPAGSTDGCPFCKPHAMATVMQRLTAENLLQELPGSRPITI